MRGLERETNFISVSISFSFPKFFIASPNDPTPGRIRASAFRISSGEEVMIASSPALVQAFFTLKRLPIL